MAEPTTPQSVPARQQPVIPAQTPNPQCSLAADASPSNPDVLRILYSVLLKTRLLEEQILSLLRKGKLHGVAPPLLGGEATEVGACIGLQPDDSFSSSQPTFAAHVVNNTPLEQCFARLFGRTKPDSTHRDGSEAASWHVLPQSSTITGQLDVATGVALGYRQLAKPNVVVALAEDGVAALGFWHEAASLASRHRLPIVFIVENSIQPHANGAGIAQSSEDLRDRAEAYGFPGITVDGNDLIAVWRVAQESIHRARSGAGPTLIECCTSRRHADSGISFTNGNSRAVPLHLQSQHDPLHHLEHYMKKRNLWKQPWKDQIIADYRKSLSRAVASVEALSRSTSR